MRAAVWLLAALSACAQARWEPPPGMPLAPPVPGVPSEPAAASTAFDEPHTGSFDEPSETDPALADLRREARALEPLVASDWVKQWLRASEQLAAPPAATIFHSEDKKRYWTSAEANALSETERASLTAQSVDARLYYYTKYGSPLAYARPLDVAAAHGMGHPAGRAIVDFGYGGIGHLLLLASLGARVTAVDVDPFLRALYAGASGALGKGEVRLLHGAFPTGVDVPAGQQLFIAKNVLKNGYIHPAEEVPAGQRIDLGVSDADFVAALARAVGSGGLVLIYNISPAPNAPGRPYRTWADGRCPFPRALWQSSGFEVLALDVDDSAAARAQGRALGWDRDVDLEKEIHALYTVARRR